MRKNAYRGSAAGNVVTLRSRRLLRSFAWALISGLSIEGARAAGALDQPVTFDIPANISLEQALIDWGTSAHITVMINTQNVGWQLTEGLHRTIPARDALTILLQNSGLTYTEDGGVIRVVPIKPWVRSSLNTQPEEDSTVPRTRLMETGGRGAASANESLNEVVITAQKRQERLIDVPVPVTAINADVLTENNDLRLADYYTEFPSLVLTQGVQSNQSFTIRGLPSSTILIDGLPVSGYAVPDIDPSNLERVEVLRGPQGTLYGANSLGGLISYVTADPSFDKVSGHAEVGGNTVYNGYDLGYETRGAVNVPLTNYLALRASAFFRQDPGYIDNPDLHLEGINHDHAGGGYLALLIQPSDIFSLKLSALYQSISGGNADVNLPTSGYPVTASVGDLQQTYAAGVGPYERNFGAYSAILKAKFFRDVQLTSLTGYVTNRSDDYYDLSQNSYWVGYTEQYFGVSGAPVYSKTNSPTFTQEFRLSTPIGTHLDFLLGQYYSHAGQYTGIGATSSFEASVLATNPITGALAGTVLYDSFGSRFSEYATYLDLTWHLTGSFDIQVGGREDRTIQDSVSYLTGPYVGPTAAISPILHANTRAFTYLASPSLKISQNVMVYGRFASGFVPGGTNSPPNPKTPPTFGPEKTYNYELGAKGELFDRRLTIDASLYYIDFAGLQNPFYNSETGLSYGANAGEAKSQGAEINVEVQPVTGLKLAGWLAFSDAKLTDLPQSVIEAGVPAAAGEPLPNTARFSGSLSMDQEFPITDGLQGYAGVSEFYMGDRMGVYAATRETFPAYAKTDLRAGVRRDPWAFRLYVNNLTDRRGIISGENSASIPYSYYLIQPRTIGFSVSWTF